METPRNQMPGTSPSPFQERMEAEVKTPIKSYLSKLNSAERLTSNLDTIAEQYNAATTDTIKHALLKQLALDIKGAKLRIEMVKEIMVQDVPVAEQPVFKSKLEALEERIARHEKLLSQHA